LSRNSQTQQPTSSLAGGANSIANATFSTGVGMAQTLPWGGAYTANWNNSRFTTTNLFSSFSPQLNSNINLQYQQPFLRNFSIDSIRQQLENSKKTRELSDIQLQGVITQTLRNVRNAYWDLAYTIANLKAQQQSLTLSQQSLRDNQKRVEIGTMAPIDIVQAQAEVASNEQGVIIAEANIKTAQDTLRTLVLDPAHPISGPSPSSQPTRRRSKRRRSTSTPRCATPSRSGPICTRRKTASSRAISTSASSEIRFCPT
jgi:outer membrane protein TolC